MYHSRISTYCFNPEASFDRNITAAISEIHETTTRAELAYTMSMREAQVGVTPKSVSIPSLPYLVLSDHVPAPLFLAPLEERHLVAILGLAT